GRRHRARSGARGWTGWKPRGGGRRSAGDRRGRWEGLVAWGQRYHLPGAEIAVKGAAAAADAGAHGQLGPLRRIGKHANQRAGGVNSEGRKVHRDRLLGAKKVEISLIGQASGDALESHRIEANLPGVAFGALFGLFRGRHGVGFVVD